MTYLDEVHSVGLYGEKGKGIAVEMKVDQEIDIINGTLAKAFGQMGGYIAASNEIIDYIRSFSLVLFSRHLYVHQLLLAQVKL